MDIHNVISIVNDAAFICLNIKMDEGIGHIDVDPRCTMIIRKGEHDELVVEIVG